MSTKQSPDLFAWFVACGFLGVVILAMVHGIPEGTSHDMVLMLLTAMVTNYGTVVSFRYGSTASSETKNKAISDLAQASATTATSAAPPMTTTTTTSTTAVPGAPVTNSAEEVAP